MHGKFITESSRFFENIWFPAEWRDLSFLYKVQTGSGVHRAFYPVSTADLYIVSIEPKLKRWSHTSNPPKVLWRGAYLANPGATLPYNIQGYYKCLGWRYICIFFPPNCFEDSNIKNLENRMRTRKIYLETFDVCYTRYSSSVNEIFEFLPCAPQYDKSTLATSSEIRSRSSRKDYGTGTRVDASGLSYIPICISCMSKVRWSRGPNNGFC
jgi:hypothetical protein